MYSYPALYPNGMREAADVCTDCQTPFRYVMVKNLKIDNGDPDLVMHQYCPNCEEPPKTEPLTKLEMGHLWD